MRDQPRANPHCASLTAVAGASSSVAAAQPETACAGMALATPSWPAWHTRAQDLAGIPAEADRWHPALARLRDRLRALAGRPAWTDAPQVRRSSRGARRRSGQQECPAPGAAPGAAGSRDPRLAESKSAAAVRVSAACVERALTIVNALAHAVEDRGFGFGDDPRVGRLFVYGHGCRVFLRISERLQKSAEPIGEGRGQRAPIRRVRATGLLVLTVQSGSMTSTAYCDVPGDPLEQQLPKVLRSVCKHMARSQASNGAPNVEPGSTSVARSPRSVWSGRGGAAAPSPQDTQSRERALVSEALDWQGAAAIRQYVARIERAAGRGAGNSTAAGRWCEWALGVADQLDPVARRLTHLEADRQD